MKYYTSIYFFTFVVLVHGKFTCKSGENLNIEKICDGIADCPDSSDEEKGICGLSM